MPKNNMNNSHKCNKSSCDIDKTVKTLVAKV